MPEDNGKKNPNESYTNKCQRHFPFCYSYKLACTDNKFSKHLKLYFVEDAVYNFISSMTKEGKYCSDVMKKHSNKELVMTSEDKEDFEKSTKCWICDNDYNNTDVKVRDYCRITEKCRGSAHRDCNINVKLNYKIPIVLHNLKKYDSHLNN